MADSTAPSRSGSRRRSSRSSTSSARVHEGQAEERPRASSSRSRRPGASPASLRRRSSKTNVISSVGGIKIPPVDGFIAGYQYCAKKVEAGHHDAQRLLPGLRRPGKCKEVALKQIAARSRTSSSRSPAAAASARCRAPRSRRKWGIGVDTDQAFLGKHILTSATKKVDVGRLQTHRAVAKARTFKGGDRHPLQPSRTTASASARSARRRRTALP